jgi:hypothetical protein
MHAIDPIATVSRAGREARRGLLLRLLLAPLVAVGRDDGV